jgi:hypothetical protein
MTNDPGGDANPFVVNGYAVGPGSEIGSGLRHSLCGGGLLGLRFDRAAPAILAGTRRPQEVNKI